MIGKEELNGRNGTGSGPTQETISSVALTDLQGSTQDSGGAQTSGNLLQRVPPLRLILRWFPRKFQQAGIEELYQKYSSQSRTEGISVAILLCVVINLTSITSSAYFYTSTQVVSLSVMGGFLLVNIVLFILLRSGVFPKGLRKLLPLFLWFLMSVQLYCDVIIGAVPVAPSSGVAWQACIIFSIHVVLALKLRWCLVLGALSAALHTVVVVSVPHLSSYASVFDFVNTICSNLVFYMGVMLLGIVAFFIIDKGYRNDFIGIKDSLSVNLQIEESAREQEGLLLSVLPRHVATEMIKDLGGQLTGQFRKVYMNRHEDVSILFADIVGFTAMSSSVTPAELVQILNDLFATFDKLANTYHQLRIKILGDCYYCVCGCPDPRPDHAVLAIHMGLSMVDAIREVDEKTQSGVNMRVGVHTGAILGGVLGQNRWQYDVVGKEVVLANQMESSGIAGRVHISSITAKCLSGEFELESGDGELRDDGIRGAGLKTYLIKSVLQAYPKGTLDEGQPVRPVEQEEGIPQRRTNSTMRDLEEALIDREKSVSRLGKHVNPLTQHFREADKEADFRAKRQSYGAVAMVMTVAVFCFCFLAQILITQISTLSFIAFIIGIIFLTFLSVILLSTSFPKLYPRLLVSCASWIGRTRWAMSLYVALAMVLLGCQGLVAMLSCKERPPTNYTVSVTWLDPQSPYCDYVSYFSHLLVLVQLCAIIQVQISYLVQSALNLCLTVIYLLLNVLLREDTFSHRDQTLYTAYTKKTSWKVPSTHLTTSFMLVGVSIILGIYARNLERVARRLFFYRRQMDEVQSQIDVLRRKNEALVYNILPPHVAKHFIGRRRKDEELYSHHYEEAGVMFASCPNFNTHYTEDAVNNNGLEWIRFLNEVLSDYDDLLNEARFSNVIKIKTVGSTYMAASGINQEKSIPKNASINERWQHLADLVAFGFAMRETLDRINAQSFNTFMLRIGLKHGPLLAGVIGAGKPHYDIWGNTVNVASRMDSTGQLGKIQVTQDTKEILDEFGFVFEKRGIVKVKGKGELLTYFLLGKGEETALPNQVSPCSI